MYQVQPLKCGLSAPWWFHIKVVCVISYPGAIFIYLFICKYVFVLYLERHRWSAPLL